MSLAAWLPTALVAALLLASPCSGLAPATRLSRHRPALRARAITAAADADPARRPVVVPKDSPSQPPGASLATSTINLVKGVIGSSVFALPAGVAAFASTRAALVPSFLLLGAVATLSGYTFWMIARVNEATDTDSFGGAWRATFGESTSWVPSAIIVAKCFASCLTSRWSSATASRQSWERRRRRRGSRRGAARSSRSSRSSCCRSASSPASRCCATPRSSASPLSSIRPVLVVPAPAPPLAAAAAAATAAARSPLALAMTAKVFVLISSSPPPSAHYNAPPFYAELAPAPTVAGRSPFYVRRAGGRDGDGEGPIPTTTTRQLPTPPAAAAATAIAAERRRGAADGSGDDAASGRGGDDGSAMGGGFWAFGAVATVHPRNFPTSDRLAQLARLAVGSSSSAPTLRLLPDSATARSPSPAPRRAGRRGSRRRSGSSPSSSRSPSCSPTSASSSPSRARCSLGDPLRRAAAVFSRVLGARTAPRAPPAPRDAATAERARVVVALGFFFAGIGTWSELS